MIGNYDILSSYKKLHFVGIGGVSMSTVALLAVKNGCSVSGSDRVESEAVKKLREQGIEIYIGHSAGNINGADAVVFTAAVDGSNPELAAAKELGIPLISRAEYLGYLMSGYSSRIGVSGTHGKTTTTSMISHIFIDAGLDPTVANGAILPEIGGAYRIGSKENFIYEACEYKDSFLSFCPTDAVITNVELDHTDYFRSLDHMVCSFSKAVENARRVFVNKDCEKALEALKGYKGQIVTVSLNDKSADFSARGVVYTHGMPEFTLTHRGEPLCRIKLQLIGEFNLCNALCAAAVAYSFGVGAQVIASSLATFTGASRRFERKGIINGVAIYDDYAHHPSECFSTLNAVKNLGYKRVFCIFQPHTYSRTHDLLTGFEMVFSQAVKDGVNMIFATIYAARETDTMGVSSDILASDIGALSFDSFEKIADYLAANVQKGDLVLTMGAGDVYKVGRILMEKLQTADRK